MPALHRLLDTEEPILTLERALTGLFIVFEGLDGTGKTTQLQRLGRELQEAGFSAVVTREPGGCQISEAIRCILKAPEFTAMAPLTELLLFAAARTQHLTEVVLPALQAGKIVLCDRFIDSTRAYQGAGRSLPPSVVESTIQLATDGFEPDLTLILDLELEQLQHRLETRGETVCRLDAESLDFRRCVRDEYLKIAERWPRRQVIDASGSANAVSTRIRSVLQCLDFRLNNSGP